MIDLIIPALNAHKHIDQTIISIIDQSIADKIKVTIVNDGGKTYDIEWAKRFIDIQVLDLAENVGIGQARQYGIDNTDRPYIMFCDADDKIYAPLGAEMLYRYFKADKDLQKVAGMILTRNEKGEVAQMEQASVHVHAKMFSRKALKQKGIRFIESKAYNEDTGFTTQCKLLFDKVAYDKNICYYYNRTNSDSVTARNGRVPFTYAEGFDGWTENIIFALKHYYKMSKDEPHKATLAYKYLMGHYVFYVQSKFDAPEQSDKILAATREYYKQILKPYDTQDNFMLLILNYTQEIASSYAHDKMRGAVPDITIYDFFEEVRK